MAGKWHLGHAQHKMTPVGRGFDYFTGGVVDRKCTLKISSGKEFCCTVLTLVMLVSGMYMWDVVDSYTKQMWELPWEAPLVVDWVRERRHYNSTEGIPARLSTRWVACLL
jgi:hypothetical protein